ncbi:pantetheine-phosphate adenylyltransferase [Phaeovibrio sulfidiphilus]|uniref:Phosphopantetheine adenylyltransferase n=1 Tax=Phaeovibrio sulfidiphilus TaxID=1220600 RepID=A0A8J6YWK6_9PROT|nr:pantetheine-phosphate adenylyltransferase [Phaeovibrio sulfidiphilus]MBE1237784.1 pantetheine-phosphate adenylyltransferase [Phaeovibrio sulfidiphilus]
MRRSAVTGIYPGTFDPITNGHIDIITRATRFVDRLVIGVADNRGKGPLFTLEERVAMIGKALQEVDTGKAEIEVIPFSNLLVDFAVQNNASIVVRGLRAVSDYEYEIQMVHMNARLNPTIESIFLMASEGVQAISSSFVKEICRLGGDVSEFVPVAVLSHLQDRIAQQRG